MSDQHIKAYEKDTLDYRIFLSVSVVAIGLSVFSLTVDYIFIATPIDSIVDILGLIYFTLVFLIVRFKRIYKPLIYPTLIVIFLISPAYWLDVGYINVIGTLVYIAAIVMAIFIAPRSSRKNVLFAFLALTILYPAADIIYHNINGTYDPTTTSSYFYFVFITIGIGYATSYMKNNYEIEKQSIRTFGKSLRDLHRLNLSDWQSIDDTFKDYLNTGSKLLGAEKAFITKKE